MSNIDKIKGPGTPPESSKGSTKKSSLNEHEFKEFMKVDAVNETDPEQKRKRKQRAEKREESEIEEPELEELSATETSFTSSTTQLNLPDTTPSIAPKSEEKQTVKPHSLSPSASQQKNSENATESTEPEKTTQPKEAKNAPQSKESIASPTTQTVLPSPRSIEQEREAENQETLKPAPLQNPQANPIEQKREAEIQETLKPAPLQNPQANPIEQKREAEKKGTLEPQPPPVLEETEGYFQQNRSILSSAHEEELSDLSSATPQTLPLSIESNPLTTPPLETEKKIESPDLIAANIAPTSALPFSPSSATPPTLPVYTQLSPQVFDLFERMVGVITVMRASLGISETTIHLTSEQFISSIFYGTQIIIREDKNAQNQFNIEINTLAHTAPLLQGSVKELLTAFEKGGYKFEVKQIRINLVEGSKDSFKRKVEDKNKEEEEMP